MTWVTIGKIHIRAEQILTFHWQGGRLCVWYICEPAETYEWADHDQKIYRSLCKQLGIEPAVESPYGLDEELDDCWPHGED